MKIFKYILPILSLLLIPLFLFASNDIFTPPQLYIKDTINLLSESEKDSLNKHIEKIKQETTVEIGILIINSTNGKDVSELALEVGRAWGVGKKDIDNGLMMLFAIDDRDMSIQTGEGLEGSLPDISISRLQREFLIPNFKKQEYYKGISEFINTFEKIIEGDETVVSQYKAPNLNFEPGFTLQTVYFFLLILQSFVTALKELIKRKRNFFKSLFQNLAFAIMVFFITKDFDSLLTLTFLVFLYTLIKFLSIFSNGKGGSGRWRGPSGGWGGGSSGGSSSSSSSSGGFGGGSFSGGGSSASW